MQWQVRHLNRMFVLRLPTAQIAVMGPEAAVNAVYSNKIEAIEDPKERIDLFKKNIKNTKKKSIFIS